METPPTPRRKGIRYADYDYRRAGAYFVTVCAAKGESIFGQIVDGTMITNSLGEIAQSCWSELSSHFSFVVLDTSIIMPNHMHGLLWLHPSPVPSDLQNAGGYAQIDASTTQKDAMYGVPTNIENGAREESGRRFGSPLAGSLSTIVSSYKAAVTRQARRNGVWGDGALWQRRFWDRIVRDDEELNNIRNYIIDNPNRWTTDQLHPDAPPNRFNQWTDNL